MSQPTGSPNQFSRDDALPPVEAPNAGFILQLFVIPGMIVVTIFAIVGMLRWLAQTPSDPRAYVAGHSEFEPANAACRRWRRSSLPSCPG